MNRRSIPKALVVYESMYGNTKDIAEAVGDGMDGKLSVQVQSVDEVSASDLDGYDIVVFGAPAHAHGLSAPLTRAPAQTVSGARGTRQQDFPRSAGVGGFREELKTVTRQRKPATFDARPQGPVFLTGRAGTALRDRLNGSGFDVIRNPESFRVTTDPTLMIGELSRATRWGQDLAAEVQGRQ